MSELPDAARMLEAAERAARTENLALADELLRRAAHIQEVELGPLHPDLANTLNNLAIVAEKAGRLDEAEAFYRRAVAITSASLPADHPMVAASRENLEDFCRARGLPIDKPAEIHSVDAGLTTDATAQPSIAPLPVPVERAPSASEPPLSGSRRVSRSLVWAAIGVFVVVATATFLLMRRPSSSREALTTGPATELTTQPQDTERTAPQRAEPPAPPGPVEQAQSPTVVPPAEERSDSSSAPSGGSPSSGAITLATAELCRTFSTAGAIWRCDPIADAVSRGPLVFYTRVRSPRDAVVVHRWYRGDTLRQSVKLTIRASATEGYRTYSRQTVEDGAWRVEVSSANGDLLHEQRFAVR
jgi:hypothetical protein